MLGLLKWDAHLDYYRVTCAADVTDLHAVQFAEAASKALKQGGIAEDEHTAHYLGYYGRERGATFYGARNDGWMVQTSGPSAGETFLAMREAPGKPTRVDLALTIWLSEYEASYAHRVAESVAGARAKGVVHQGLRVALINGYGHGDTAYIGARTSEQFGRCYDKEKESGQAEFAHAWRFEIEYKGEKAQQVARSLRTDAYSPEQIGSTVVAWFRSHGSPLPPDVSVVPPVPLGRLRHEEDDTRILAWIATSVKPAVRRLISKGKQDLVYYALGLADAPGESADNF